MQTIQTIHIASASLFLLDFIIKTFLLLSSSTETLEKYKRFSKVPSMVISTIFLVSGVYLISVIGMKNVGGWFHLKLTLVLIGIAVGVIGFKKNNKAMAIIATLLFVYIFRLSQTQSVTLNIGKAPMPDVVTDTTAANYDIIVHGKAVFVTNCAKCHGEDGKAGINGASNLTASLCENRGLIGIIKHGRKLMPAYKDLLSEQEIKAVAEYVKTLRTAQE